MPVNWDPYDFFRGGGSKYTGIVLQGQKLKTKKFWNQTGKPHTMKHGRDHLSVFGSKFNGPIGF